jgi:O-antigen ligase
MSTAALPAHSRDQWSRNSQSRDQWSRSAVSPSQSTPPWPLFAVAALVGLTYFLTEHSLDISLVDAYTQTAEEMELAAGGGNATRRIMFLALAGMGPWLLWQRTGSNWNVNWPLALAMGTYLTVSFGSYFWAADPSLCFRRLIMFGCCVLAATGIARRFTMRELCLLTVAAVGPLVAIGLAAELSLGTFRPWSGEYRFSGSVHPNTQGMYLTVLGLAAMGLARSPAERWRRAYWALFAATIILGLLTKSRTGNAATLLAIGVVFLLQTPLRFKFTAGAACGWLGLAALWVLLVCGFNPLTDFREALLLGRAEQSDTLSGRAFIWPLVTYYIGFRPWLGYGYESFWNPAHIDTISDELQWGLREAHNGYLEVLLSTGIVGLTCGIVAVLLALVAAGYGSVRRGDPAYSLPLGMLVFGVVSSAMESGMVGVMLPPVILGCTLVKMALFSDPIETNQHVGQDLSCRKAIGTAG